jgi:hypothetical protein
MMGRPSSKTMAEASTKEGDEGNLSSLVRDNKLITPANDAEYRPAQRSPITNSPRQIVTPLATARIEQVELFSWNQ